VVDSVEELLYVHVYYPSLSSPHIVPGRLDRPMGAAAKTKSIARFGKPRVEQWTEHLVERLLDQPIDHGRNTQLPYSSIALRYLYPTHCPWLVLPVKQLLFDSGPLYLEVGAKFTHRHLIYSRSPLIPFHPMQGLYHVLACDHRFH
jgi:hypothetical protein